MDSNFLQSAGFIEAKTNIPILRSGFITRPRLNSILNDSDKNLYLIHAPAGYGKTSLVIDFIKEYSKKTAWLSIDSSDNNLSGFFRNLCFAINKAESDLLTDVLSMWTSESKLQSRSMLDIIINKLTLIEEEFIIVLDDFHFINSEEIYQLIEQLINWIPQNVKIILLSRRRLTFRNIPKLKLNEQIHVGVQHFCIPSVIEMFSVKISISIF